MRKFIMLSAVIAIGMMTAIAYQDHYFAKLETQQLREICPTGYTCTFRINH